MAKCDLSPSILDKNGELKDKNLVLKEPDLKELEAELTPPATITFYNPRERQRTIAKGRDFYVTGKIRGVYILPDDAIFILNIYEKNPDGSFGKMVRSVFCQKKDDMDHLYVEDEYELLSPFNGEERETTLYDWFKDTVKCSCVPDLVYDKVDDERIAKGGINKRIGPPSLQWPWNKAYYTDTFFSALIYGGEFGPAIKAEVNRINKERYHESLVYKKPFKAVVRPIPYTKDGIEYLNNKFGNENPEEIVCMQEGQYVIQVSIYKKETVGSNNPYGFSSDEYIARGSLDIEIGTISDKIMSTFSYLQNVKRLKEIEEEKNWTLLWDPFPGIWVSSIITDPIKDVLILRLPNGKYPFHTHFEIETDRARANFNDALEYRTGNIRFIDYGVMKYSNTLIAEYPELLKRKDGYAQNLFTYYYDNGEPFENDHPNDYHLLDQEIKYLYVEIDKAGILKDGVCDRKISADARAIEKLPLNTPNIRVKPGYKVSVAGVCKVPEMQCLQQRDEELAYRHIDLWNSFLYQAPKNRSDAHRKGELSRSDGEYTKVGVLEFKHVFDIPKEWIGRHIKIVATSAYSTASQRLQIGTALDGETVLEFDVDR